MNLQEILDEYRGPNYFAASAWTGHAPIAHFLPHLFSGDCTYVELGTHYGYSLFAINQAFAEKNQDIKSFAIDTWQGDQHAGSYDVQVFEQVDWYAKTHYSQIKLLKMTFEEALPLFQEQEISLLLIDGLHTYEAAKQDFYSWLPKMRADGIVLLHDIHVYREDFGVHRLWQEIKSKFQTIELIHGNGLGIVFLSENLPESQKRFFTLYLQDPEKVQGMFASAGELIHQKAKEIAVYYAKKEIKESLSLREKQKASRRVIASDLRNKLVFFFKNAKKN